MSNLFDVHNEQELQVLHRALMEAKFAERPSDTAIPGSPYLADMANRVVAKLSELDPSWTEWRKARGHEEMLAIVKRHIEECRRWTEWTKEEKVCYVNILLSPLVADEQLLEVLVNGNSV